jgi:ubiquinone/menaquinone biosynthesis C-methylase UbiE
MAEPDVGRHTVAMDEAERSEAVARVTRVFDGIAERYDQSGVPFFGPIADRLCRLLDVRPGEHAVDVGCGRGAVTLRLAAATGPDGSVTAVDVSEEMVRRTRALVAESGLGTVTVEVMDASRPTLPEDTYDVVASSLVLFFLPDPGAGLSRWLRLLRPGGRIGVTTFGDPDETWKAVDALFRPYLPPALLDPRTTGGVGTPFDSDAGMEQLMSDAGGIDVHTDAHDQPVPFADAEEWRRWSMSTGQSVFWGFVPEAEREPLFDRAAALLEKARDGDRLVLHQQVRHTLAHR